ncbi:lectin-like protein [Lacipirellula limnantheis]|uniref:Lectin C-type domain protein n=1 Tax=Lacipirellula limnantheis TaxID=2528024 RepID=A0A517U5I4_9BACT|nr:lectin-like protein [Lacipirellula limnantheis]QDT75896.1 Lectin C-type domain protein [Lacipirellula limnantheis]
MCCDYFFALRVRLALLAGPRCSSEYFFVAVAPIAAQPLEYYEIFNTVVRNPTNGHYYELIKLGSATRTFAESSAAAGAKSYQGIPGHLVTITSQAEQDFIDNTYQRGGNYQVWMGASDSAIEGEWRWVTGPEAGQLFWRTESTKPVITGVAFGFESWGAHRYYSPYYDGYWYFEPSNGGELGNNEDFATFAIGRGTPNITRWRDLPGEYSRGLRDWVQCYMVEYSIPEPASMTLMMVAALAFPRRGQRRAAC